MNHSIDIVGLETRCIIKRCHMAFLVKRFRYN